MKATKQVQSWLKGLGLEGGARLERKTPKRERALRKTRKGAIHTVNPVYKPGLVGITPARYRHLHMGATRRAPAGRKMAKTRRTGGS